MFQANNNLYGNNCIMIFKIMVYWGFKCCTPIMSFNLRCIQFSTYDFHKVLFISKLKISWIAFSVHFLVFLFTPLLHISYLCFTQWFNFSWFTLLIYIPVTVALNLLLQCSWFDRLSLLRLLWVSEGISIRTRV